MKHAFVKAAIVALLVAPAVVFGQSRESVKSSSPYNGSAGRVSDKEKEKAAAEKFNGQKPDAPQKTKPQPHSASKSKPVQGATENGGRVKNAKTNNGNTR
ncbi:hypothetical protein ACFSUS_03210 [Spirosoma soli]|uniref:Uncharacterized protein n=1 Tax=Spirosoma soli TaxID=1770529 RepID=A0ABW5M041_9BACT